MPTEEVYTAPDCRRVNGKVFGAKPLVYEGNLIEGFSLTFRDGKVTDFQADKGADILRELLDTDDGASRLGRWRWYPLTRPSPTAVFFLQYPVR